MSTRTVDVSFAVTLVPRLQVAFLLCGVVMTAIALVVAVQGSRKGRKLFRAEEL